MMTIEEAIVALQGAANDRKARVSELVELSTGIIAQVAAQFDNGKHIVQRLDGGAVQIARIGTSHDYVRLSPLRTGRILMAPGLSDRNGDQLYIYEDAMKAVVNALYHIDKERGATCQ